MPLLKGRTDPFDMIKDIRYDKVFEPMGVYTEHVEQPDEIIPALERALSSGKTSLINVFGDKSVWASIARRKSVRLNPGLDRFTTRCSRASPFASCRT